MLSQLWGKAVNSTERPKTIAEFNQFDFPTWESEESVIILEANKKKFTSLDAFWLSCFIETLHPNSKISAFDVPEDLSNADITRLECYQYNGLMKNYAKLLKKPIPEVMFNPQNYLSGKHIYIDWDEEWIISDHNNKFLALKWWMRA